jgi:ubiquinol-cytochrome c reductase cytochrome c1 subunit
MRDLKILVVVVALTLVVYWGVEPLAHSQMHPHVAAPDYSYKDVDGLGGLEGNKANGKTLVESNCIACHSIESQGFSAPMDNVTAGASYGVTPPDLSSAGKIYDANYLAAFIKNPAKASEVEHKFTDGKTHPMPVYDWMQPSEIADMVAYLQSIAPKTMTNKEVFSDACGRCHGIKYADMKGGSMNSQTPLENLTTYLGTTPPDLSQYIKSRGEGYLHEFINKPSKHLEGTAMPKVGLTKKAEDQVVAYMKEVGDSKAKEREDLAPKFLLYLVIFAALAWAWKIRVWKEVH